MKPDSDERTRYLAFLRAINVGGHRVKMDQLRELFAELGLTRVETVIASGNIVFEAPAQSTEVLERQIEAHLEAGLGYPVATFIRTPEEIAAIAEQTRQPFLWPGSDDDPQSLNLYVAFLHNPPDANRQRRLMECRSELDEFRVSGREVYWYCRATMSQSSFTGARLEKVLNCPTTLRNATTVQRLTTKYPPATGAAE